MTSRPKYNQYLTSNRRQVPAGLNPSLSCIIIKVIDTIPVINLVIDTIKCCIKLVIDTSYSPCLSCILLRS